MENGNYQSQDGMTKAATAAPDTLATEALLVPSPFVLMGSPFVLLMPNDQGVISTASLRAVNTHPLLFARLPLHVEPEFLAIVSQQKELPVETECLYAR